MTRLFFFICFFSVFFSASAQKHDEKVLEHHCLYEENSLTIGIASPYSFEVNAYGVNARMYYNIGETICFGPEYAYFKTDEVEIIDFDFIGHYIIETPWVGIYPLVGINYTIEKEVTYEEIHAEVGLVFGAGMHRNYKSFTAFIEYSRVELGIDDQFFSIGIMYNLK